MDNEAFIPAFIHSFFIALGVLLGGTFDAFYSFERGIFQGETRDIVKQVLLIISAMGGAQTGWHLIIWLTQEHIS
jgi:hypothetical protein